MAILEVSHLSKVYGQGENQVVALDDVSLTIEQGEFVAIVGASGSGKSTLLHLLGGVDYPTSGKVLVNGTDIFNLKSDTLSIFRRREIGLVYQFYNLIPVLNVVDNITLPVDLDSQKVDKSYLNELLHTLGLTNRQHHLPHQLSGGQQQRVSIGRALMPRPTILLADEPTGNLDTTNSNETLQLLKLANEKYKQTLVVITHDMNIALQANRVITLQDGRIVKDEVIRV
ncbi:ABC transporter ATP-binding protein [Carnobacteriaceae bacterium zg-ZUI252]|nr:ABC transporter ATP-binding protein [Carnobacteriaceae bacterium zg-ZUI252]MBS4770557.1 ABC transporter ATP-binding protein [Carnobacteriaceae bacterium zg-ZUI240]QTU82602.1 ABC transporter ATP-binding protein [Carnobacteriaceae bacterium zg-C25]